MIKTCDNCDNYRTYFDCSQCDELDEWTPNKPDTVNRPEHYADRQIETIDYIRDNMTAEQFKGYLEGNIIKYISRYKKKNGLQDLLKAQWYLKKLIQECENAGD